MGTFSKQQWQQVAANKLSGDESITDGEIQEILDCLWEYLPPLFTKKVNEILERDEIAEYEGDASYNNPSFENLDRNNVAYNDHLYDSNDPRRRGE